MKSHHPSCRDATGQGLITAKQTVLTESMQLKKRHRLGIDWW
jgi:hypothetical protein